MQSHKFLFFKDENIVGRNSYAFFKKNKRFTDKKFDEFHKWKIIASGLITMMNALHKKSDGGLYLKDWGYFLYLPKYKVRGRRISLVRRKPDKFLYENSFIPLCDELLPFRVEGEYRTDKILIPKIETLNFADEFEKTHKLLRGYFNHKDSTKYLQL